MKSLSALALALAAFGVVFGATKGWRAYRTPSAPPDMVWIPGGEFTMGTEEEEGWPDEKPTHPVRVSGFWMDAHEVTNADFEQFVKATSYVTTAEKAPTAEEILAQSPPGTPAPPAETLVPGALVFTPPNMAVPLDAVANWWTWTPGANWRHPEGPDSNIAERMNHPVVQVSWDDAAAYAKWAKKRLPTEAEWERAARGGVEKAPYVWGTQRPSNREPQANIWQGEFPHHNTLRDGYLRTAPIGSFPPNPYGLCDMAGNVWEWCADWYDHRAYMNRSQTEATIDPLGEEASRDPRNPFTPQRSQRGGSFLCNDSYCSRYRPSARHGCSPDTGMSHVGFRCVRSPEP